MVAMDAECTAAGSIDTKQSAVVIDRYRPPSGFRQIAGLVFTLCIRLQAEFCSRDTASQNTAMDVVFAYWGPYRAPPPLHMD